MNIIYLNPLTHDSLQELKMKEAVEQRGDILVHTAYFYIMRLITII